MAAAAVQSPSTAFAIVVPGRPLQTFTQIADTKFTTIVHDPTNVHELVALILQPLLAAQQGVGVYYAVDPQHWVFIGYLSLPSPSANFKAPWKDLPADCPSLQIGFSVEPLQFLESLVPAEARDAAKTLDIAHGIGKNLFDFMSSFSKGNVFEVPVNAFDRWWTRFQEKQKREPYFFLKQRS